MQLRGSLAMVQIYSHVAGNTYAQILTHCVIPVHNTSELLN